MAKTTLILTTLLFVMSGIANGAPVDLPRTGQTTCYAENGTVINCASTGQDGDTLTGVAWPVPRFTDNGDQTITDNLTGLMWLANGRCLTPIGQNPPEWRISMRGHVFAPDRSCCRARPTAIGGCRTSLS